MNARPYSLLLDVLRFTLEQVEIDLSSRPTDPELIELKLSVQRRLALLESWGAHRDPRH